MSCIHGEQLPLKIGVERFDVAGSFQLGIAADQAAAGNDPLAIGLDQNLQRVFILLDRNDPVHHNIRKSDAPLRQLSKRLVHMAVDRSFELLAASDAILTGHHMQGLDLHPLPAQSQLNAPGDGLRDVLESGDAHRRSD
ncbi:hypothetical protein D3C73_1300410 [compost metagenome]